MTDQNSNTYLAILSSRAKMVEFGVPEEDYIKMGIIPSTLFPKILGQLGDISYEIASGQVLPDRISDPFKEWLVYAARYFDTYFQSNLEQGLNDYFLIISAAAYYISELPGSAQVISSKITLDDIDLHCSGLDKLLIGILRNEIIQFPTDQFYSNEIIEIQEYLRNFLVHGIDNGNIENLLGSLRNKASASNLPREFLFADIIVSVIRAKLFRSSWNRLPIYSGSDKKQWEGIIAKRNFIKELWPSQILLGESGVLSGRSAVIQMPTSAGKTRAAELIIWSAFLSGRTNFMVFIAPFRALCHEISDSLRKAFTGENIIINEISDVPQEDYFFEEDNKKNILVITPEKLLYILRHRPELASLMGLIIYDEGHQFDTGQRGVTYELLITSLKSLIPENAQSVLISAVISNAEDINEWLNKDGIVVNGSNLLPTYRTVGFASWADTAGRIQYVNRNDPDQDTYFVPRIIRQQSLFSTPREKLRYFPEKGTANESKDVAIYLGLKLVAQGSIAIFCGKKDTAAGIVERVTEVFRRNGDMPKPVDYSDKEEVSRLHYLITKNLGNLYHAKSAELGVFAHHGNTPNGIRLAIEDAMQKGSIKFIVCTSTLAQGVNLPIRYLIIHATRQGQDSISVKDFNNLMGRAGRASIYTEGSVIFADPKIYDKRKEIRFDVFGNRLNSDGNNKWEDVKSLLDPLNNEPTVSTILAAFDPIHSRFPNVGSLEFNFNILIENYSNDTEEYLLSLAEEVSVGISKNPKAFPVDFVLAQLEAKMRTIAAIESYLMTNLIVEVEGDLSEKLGAAAEELAKGTLAYKLADEDQKTKLVSTFKYLAQKIFRKIPDKTKREVFSKTFYGVEKSLDLEVKVSNLLEKLKTCTTSEEFLEVIWPIYEETIESGVLLNWNKPDERISIAKKWINGDSFSLIMQFIDNSKIHKQSAKKRMKLDIDDIVNIGSNIIGYEFVLLVSAVIEIIKFSEMLDKEPIIEALQKLQKQLKYGLKESNEIAIYEIGFADREVSKELATLFTDVELTSKNARRYLTERRAQVETILNQYPLYFQNELKIILDDES